MQIYLQFNLGNKREGNFDIITSQIITTIRLKASISILAGIRPYATNVETPCTRSVGFDQPIWP